MPLPQTTRWTAALGLVALVMITGGWSSPAGVSSCNWTAANPCPGMLVWPLNTNAKQAYKDIKKARQDAHMIQGNETGRGPKKNGLFAQFALPSVNSGAPNFDLSTLIPPGYAVVLGEIHYREAMSTEGYYGIPGAALPADAERQTFVLIGEQPSGYPLVVGGKIQYWGKWHIYQTLKSGNDYTVKEIESGNIRYCEHTIDPMAPVVRFIPCETVTQVFGVADTTKVPRPVALSYLQAIAGLASKAGVAFSVEARYQLCALQADRSKAANDCWPARTPEASRVIVPLNVAPDRRTVAAIALAKRFTTLSYDESLSPYWFSCGLGCCTADQ